MAHSENPQSPTHENPRKAPAPAAPERAPRIEDYALIGNCLSAALVSRSGSIDWLCWPRFDSPACFAALVGNADNGRWRIHPAAPAGISRRYRPGTLILETEFTTPGGTVVLIDAMAPDQHAVVRIVEGRSGSVSMAMDMALRFEYGSAVPWVTRLQHGYGMRAIAGPDQVVLHSDVPVQGRRLTTVAEFTVSAGQQVRFVLAYGPSHEDPPVPPEAKQAVSDSEAGWTTWCARGRYAGEWQDVVQRSLITLKALSYQPTGGIVAAPTTSLPEKLGGKRNWDYRFCWLRDATFTLLALMHAGYREEAQAWGAWLRRSVAGTPAQVQTLYGLGGERWVMEWEVPWLAGYQGASPVRVGNAASNQLQLDVFGEVVDALYQEIELGLVPPSASWDLLKALAGHVVREWEKPDDGIWEVRGGSKCFTFSKVMTWVALDRVVRLAEKHNLHAPLDQWRAVRQTMHDTICREGFHTGRNSFVQAFGETSLDAAVLLIPIVGFLPADDPRMLATVEAIRQDLMVDGLVMRYRTEETVDGLPAGEGVFLACSFWYVDNLVLQGRHDEARTMFQRLVELCNDVGLLSEEYDPKDRRQLGNFPQGLSHLALINSALNLQNHHGPAERRRAKH
jgi:GH15 family glucan-1,4-alpha-glucosidase